MGAMRRPLTPPWLLEQVLMTRQMPQGTTQIHQDWRPLLLG